MAVEATTWSPCPAMLKTEKNEAAWPLDVSIPAVPPSSAVSFAATMSLVGF